MQIERGQAVCPACGAEGLQIFPVLHHMICAYVGPEYDFPPTEAGYTCPKCRRRWRRNAAAKSVATRWRLNEAH